uniref:WAS/WASL interacting protein family member 3 n=1 Tax=Loxodonta africana TaxID=9785 RepID=G3TV61_LOXAF
SKGTNKEGGGSANSRGGSTPPALGDLFAGGFPVLRPAGQRDAAGGKTGLAPGSRAPSPRLPTKTISGPLNPPPSPRLGNASEAHGTARAVPPRPNMPTPQVPQPPGPAPEAQCAGLATPPAPPGPQFLQKKRHGRGPGKQPSSGQEQWYQTVIRFLPVRHSQKPAPLSRMGSRQVDYTLMPLLEPTEPPADLRKSYTCPVSVRSPNTRIETRRTPAVMVPKPSVGPGQEPFPKPTRLAGSWDRAVFSPFLLPHPVKGQLFIQSGGQQSLAPLIPLNRFFACSRAVSPRLGMDVYLASSISLNRTSGGKLNPPPAPPARSPTTELSSRSQQAPAWTPTQQPGSQLRNGSLHIMDDFESKFTFHSVEDFPPPDEYKPCQKIYPSKIPRSRTPGPWVHAEAAGQGSDDIKGRNSQCSLSSTE